MLQAFVIVFREGFESILIVAVIRSYLRKAGRWRLVSAVHGGIVASLLSSAVLGRVLATGLNRPLWEGALGLLTLPLLVGMFRHMRRAGPHLAQSWHEKLGCATAVGGSRQAWAGLFLLTTLVLTREGMETVLLLLQVRSSRWVQGAAGGVAAAVALAWAWSRYGRRIRLKRFFQVTAIFLLLFLAQTTVYSLHELSEAGIVTHRSVLRFHVLTEPYTPHGAYGRWFPLIMAGVPGLWLIAAWWKDRYVTETR